MFFFRSRQLGGRRAIPAAVKHKHQSIKHQEEVRTARRLRKRWKGRQKNPKRMAELREKFIKQAQKYFGCPYAKKYWPPGSPEYKSPRFLDCCGLVRQVMMDLKQDFGFTIGGGNQAYMYDTLPITVERARDMKPGDLVFVSAIYNNPKTKKQRHNMTHVEIWLGEGHKTIGSRWNNGKVQTWDSYKFSAKSYHSETYHFKSIDTWLKGKCVSHCPDHSWRRPVYNPSKKSIFNPQQDIEQAEPAGDDEDENNAQFQDLYVQGYNVSPIDPNQSPDLRPDSRVAIAEAKDDIRRMKTEVKLTLSKLETFKPEVKAARAEESIFETENQEPLDLNDTDSSIDEQNEADDDSTDSEMDVVISETPDLPLAETLSNVSLDDGGGNTDETQLGNVYGNDSERKKYLVDSTETELDDEIKSTAIYVSTLSSIYLSNAANENNCTWSTDGKRESEKKITNLPIEPWISNNDITGSSEKMSKDLQKACQWSNKENRESTANVKYLMEERAETLNTNQNAKSNSLLREVIEKNCNKNARPKTTERASQHSGGSTPEDMCKTYHDHSLSCPDGHNDLESGQSSRSSSRLSDESVKVCNTKKDKSIDSDSGYSDSSRFEAQGGQKGSC